MAGKKKKPEPVSYVFRKDYDASLYALEKRYGVTVNQIQIATASRSKDLRGLSESAFCEKVFDGERTVFIPLQEVWKAWTWEKKRIGPGCEFEKLADLWLRRKDGDRRPAILPLTARRLLDLPHNGFLRNSIIDEYLASLRAPPANLGAEIESFLSGVDVQGWRLIDPLPLYVPYPPPQKGHVVSVAPKSKGKGAATPATLNVPEGWVENFIEAWLTPLELSADTFLRAVTRCERARTEATKELGVVVALREAAHQMAECCPASDQRKLLEAMEKAATSLLDKSVAALTTNPFYALCPKDDDARNAAARSLYDLLFSAGFTAEVDKLMAQAPIHVRVSSIAPGQSDPYHVLDTTLQDQVAFLIERCLVPLADTTVGTKVMARVASAVDVIRAKSGSAEPLGSDADNTLAVITRLLGKVPSTAGMLVGDLPGPQALGMSLVAIRAGYLIPKAIAKGGVSAQEALGLVEKLGLSVGLDAAKRAEFVLALKSGTPGKEFAKALTDKKWKSAGWTGGMTALALVALVLTIVQEPDSMAWSTKWNGRIGGSLPVVSGLLKLVEGLLTAGGKWATRLHAGADFLGYVGCLWGVGNAAWGTVEAVLKGDVSGAQEQGLLLVVNSTLLLGLALGNPWLMAGATLVLVGYAIYGGMDGAARLFWPAQKKVFVGYLEYLGDRPATEPKKPTCYFRLLRDGDATVQSAYLTLKTIALDEGLLYWPVADQSARAKALREVGFSEADITSLKAS